MDIFSRTGVTSLIQCALEEDLALGDPTSEALFPVEHQSRADVLARQDLVVCGIPLLQEIADVATAQIEVNSQVEEGTVVSDKTILATLEGSTRHILSLERTMLNFLQRMSGVASHTREIVQSAHGITILDTRKTLPGWRVLDKYAVRVGGGVNHRATLGDMIMVKNNHLDAYGVKDAASAAEFFRVLKKDKPWHIPVECEVRSATELALLLPHNPQFIMLDNMDSDEIDRCMQLLLTTSHPPLVEASGGLTSARLKQLAQQGVKFASLGRLTTHSVNADISMRVSLR
jgi:nicotinate-nucleotide pyrophosphorylase (carboxylating)